jgi:mannose-6-phosphate isomerase-like protein (cupin superfamily)
MAKTKARPKAKATARAKTTARRSSARRPAARAKPKQKAKARPKQTFMVNHRNEADFEQGLRTYAKYRDLGVSKATNGLAQAHVIRLIGPCDPKVVSKRHYHDVDFQMIYVLKGWIRGEYEGQEITAREGSCWLQPPRIKHTVLDYSDDCELLEIILPAEFDTVELEK